MNYNEHLNGNDTMNNYNQQLTGNEHHHSPSLFFYSQDKLFFFLCTDLNSCSSIYYNVDCNGAHYHNYYSDNVPFVTYNYDNTYSYDYKSVVPNTENTSQLIPKAATADNMLTPIYSKVESNMSGTGNYLNNSSPVFNKANKMTGKRSNQCKTSLNVVNYTDTITTTSTTATFNSVIGEDKTVFEDKSIDSLEGKGDMC